MPYRFQNLIQVVQAEGDTFRCRFTWGRIFLDESMPVRFVIFRQTFLQDSFQ